MSVGKYIFWLNNVPVDDSGRRRASIQVEEVSSDGSIAKLISLIAELRKTFPSAIDDEIHPNVYRVGNSANCIIKWETYIADGEYEGWQQIWQHGIEHEISL
jgi:hypothetical protein